MWGTGTGGWGPTAECCEGGCAQETAGSVQLWQPALQNKHKGKSMGERDILWPFRPLPKLSLSMPCVKWPMTLILCALQGRMCPCLNSLCWAVSRASCALPEVSLGWQPTAPSSCSLGQEAVPGHKLLTDEFIICFPLVLKQHYWLTGMLHFLTNYNW